MVVKQGPGNRFADRLKTGKMNYRFRLLFGKNLIQKLLVKNVAMIKGRFKAGNLLYSVNYQLFTIGKIVYYYGFVPGFQQPHTCVTANIAGSAT